MVGSVSSSSTSSRGHGVDRFYNPPALRRQLQLQQQQQQQPPPQQQQQQQQQQHQQHQQRQQPSHQHQKPQRTGKQRQRAPPPPPQPAESETREVEIRFDSDDSSSKPSMSTSPSPPPTPPAPGGNLDRFLQSTTPIVPARYFQKATMRMERNGETRESLSYFCLGDLWDSFGEWSAYGAGVPLIMNGSESVIQYYVPYLSGIQLYVEPSRIRLKTRVPGENSDADMCRDSSIGGSSNIAINQCITEIVSKASLGDKPNYVQDGSSSEFCSPTGTLVFEYLERDPPYGREPLADKISLLAHRFPELKTYKSCELLPTSWISVAWYPIYRIPTGPTLRDLDACFLTFHSLSTANPYACGRSDLSSCIIRNICNGTVKSVKVPLPVFGLASYKFKGSVWTSNGMQEQQQQASSLLQAADIWLRELRVDHPDFSFFLSHSSTYQR